jgi:hypothetical protein
LDQPQKLADLGLFTNPNDCSESSYGCVINYYKVGSDTGRDLVLSEDLSGGPSPIPFLFIKTGNQQYVLLKQHSPDYAAYDPSPLNARASVDEKSAYKVLAYQKTLTVVGGIITNTNKNYEPYMYMSQLSGVSLKSYSTNGYGKVYVRTIGKGDGFEIQDFVLRMPDQMMLNYQLRPGFVADDFVPQVTWQDGKTNKDTYRIDGIGSCGSDSGLAILNTTTLSGLAESGTTKSGEKVYEFTSADNPTLKYFYEQYSTTDNGNGRQPAPGALTLAQYRSKHAIFVYQDKLGRLIVFNSTVYGANAECGKPVIYLYPTIPTTVSVRVDAKITKSDPSYGNGWNVLAMPNGKLFSGSKSYDSLFWEGTGKIYPTISSGFVIAQAGLTQTLTNQLHQLGLNDKESSDFLDFWLPKMPNTPYVRASWIGKNQMDQLAPLVISPKPDTTIRIFMEFEGLNQPIAISPQRLSAPTRRGFTVVEWGGLLRSSTAIQ